jgi:hypothetical protein
MAQWLCAVTAVTCLAPTTAAEPDPPSRVVSAGLGFGSFEGFQALVSLRPNRYASVETRAYTAGLTFMASICSRLVRRTVIPRALKMSGPWLGTPTYPLAASLSQSRERPLDLLLVQGRHQRVSRFACGSPIKRAYGQWGARPVLNTADTTRGSTRNISA